MRKLLLFLCLAVAAVVLAAAVFCFAFDANRYLPQVRERLQNVLGNPVGIDRIALRLGWDGPTAELDGFSVYPEAGGGDGTPILWLERLRIAFDALPLLRKEIRISSVSAVRPRLRLTRNAQGRWEIFSEKKEAARQETLAVSSPAAPSAASEGVAFSLGTLRIEDAEIRLHDESVSPAREVVFSHLDAVFKNPRLNEPVDFDLRLAILSKSQNVNVHGRITVSGENSGVRLRDFQVRLTARFGPGTIAASAQTTGMERNPSTAFELRAERLPLASFLPAKSPEAPRFEGELSVNLKGAAQGWDAAGFSRTLSGGGELSLERGVLVNFNLLREVLGRLSSVPGFGDTLMSRLPPVYQQRMAVAHTAFAPIRTIFRVGDGGIYFDNLQAATEDFAIGLGGRLGMDGAVSAQSVIRMQPQLSAAVCQAVPEAQYFLGPQGGLEVPAKIDGTLSHLRILPDTRAIITNIAVTRGQELISDLIQRKMGKRGSEDAASGEDAQKPDYKKLLQDLF